MGREDRVRGGGRWSDSAAQRSPHREACAAEDCEHEHQHSTALGAGAVALTKTIAVRVLRRRSAVVHPIRAQELLAT